MNKIEKMYGLVGHGTNRVKDDFYATPDSAIYALLERETFEGDVWEPACGDGAISEKLIQQGYDVYSSDLVDRGYGNAHFDFLNSWRIHDNIITNPPFNIGTQFTLHALMVAKRKVAIFNKLTFLEGKERKQKLFSQKLLKNVYVFSERQAFQGYKGGMLAFAWYVFDKSYYGDPTLYFI